MSSTATAVRPISIRPDDFPVIFGISVTKVYELIAEGAFPVRKVGRATLAFTEDVERYLRSIPEGLAEAPKNAMAARGFKKMGG
ncbi:helix-turn-helix domain-containing protein [Xanthobacter sp. V2C-8]